MDSTGAIHDIDWRDLPEQKKIQSRACAANLRQSSQLA
jgi:hypothetical protein